MRSMKDGYGMSILTHGEWEDDEMRWLRRWAWVGSGYGGHGEYGFAWE